MLDRIQKVNEFFNKTDNYLKNNLGVALRAELILKNLPDLKDKNILDIGCGNGDLTLPYIKNNKITFLDLSEKMLELVRLQIPNEYYNNAKIVNLDLSNFPFSEKFDFLFLVGVIAHVNSLELTISKYSGMLKDDGTLIIQFTNCRNITSLLIRLIYEAKKIFGKKPGYRVNYISLSKMESQLKKNHLFCYKKISYWPSLPGFRFLSESTRKFIYFKFLNSKFLQPLGGELLLFVSLTKK